MKENKSKDYSIAIGIISGIVFLICYLKINLTFIPSLLLGGVCYIFLEINNKDKAVVTEKKEQVKVNTPTSLAKIEEANKQLVKIKEITTLIKNIELRQKIVNICITCHKVIVKLNQNPEKVENEGKQFLEYYLVTFSKIIDKYYELQQSGVKSTDISSAMKEVENSIAELEQAFLEVFDSIYRDELIDLKAEMKVLKKSMEEDSFGV